MIFTDRTVKVSNGTATIDTPVIVYRGDRKIEVKFEILDAKFKFSEGTNMIESMKASYGQLAIINPNGGNAFTEIAETKDGAVVFEITGEMIDQLEEVGFYSFHIRLYDKSKDSRISLPPINKGIEVREPITIEASTDAVAGVASTGYAILKEGTDIVDDTFNADGSYNKTDWAIGDIISEDKLNKIENALSVINDKKGSGVGSAIDYDLNIKGINHRGWHLAPENTIPAFIESKINGFNYVECDTVFTSDGVILLLHDDTIDRTSNGSGNISEMTYEEALTYDFGSWKDAQYAGTKIPTLMEFLKLCKALALHPYIEVKTRTDAQIKQIADEVQKSGMKGKITYISFYQGVLSQLKNYDPSARLGLIYSNFDEAAITYAENLKTDKNEVFLNVNVSVVDQYIDGCITADVPLEMWTGNIESAIVEMNPYISGVTSDMLVAGKVLYEYYMPESLPESDPESDPEPVDIPEPVVNLSLTSVSNDIITNTGTGGSTYNVTIEKNDSGNYTSNTNGLTLENDACAKLGYAINATKTFTIVSTFSLDEVSSQTYGRCLSASKDAMVVYYQDNVSSMFVKLNGVTTEHNIIDTSFTTSGKSVRFPADFTKEELHTYAITGDATTLSFYIDGELIFTEAQTDMMGCPYIGMGDCMVSGYYNNKVTFTKYQVYDSALTQAQIASIS